MQPTSLLSGLPLILLIVFVLLFIVTTCSIFRWHPFLVLLCAAMATGLGTGFPADTVLNNMLEGGGAVFTNIGFIIALGTILGEVLERTGALNTLASAVFQKAGNQRLLPGISLLGAITGIPVFCDSGFVILSSLARSLARHSSVSYHALCIALATGLYTTHVLIPPTPGPLAAAGNLGLSAAIGWVIMIGLPVSIPSIIIGWWFANKAIHGKAEQEEKGTPETNPLPVVQGLYRALIPLLLPVLLIALGSLLPFFSLPLGTSEALQFVCHPVMALLLGVLFALLLPGAAQRKQWNGWIQNALLQAGPILLITAAGGALGAVLKATPLAADFKSLLAGKSYSLTLFLPIAYLVAAGLKTAQGSSTASMIITSSMLAPIVAGLPFHHPAEKALLVLSIGAGAMTVSHANDSYFWVVNQYSGMPVGALYRSFTTATFFMGLSVLASCLLASLLI